MIRARGPEYKQFAMYLDFPYNPIYFSFQTLDIFPLKMFSIKAAALLSLISFIKMSSIATLKSGRLEEEHINNTI